MHSHKTLYLNETSEIVFVFDETKIRFEIYINDIVYILDRPHIKFIDTFNELITEYNISNHNAKLIKINGKLESLKECYERVVKEANELKIATITLLIFIKLEE